MDWLVLFEKAFWGGLAAVGFAVLFNVPVRALIIVFILGMVGCFLKFGLMSMEVNVVFASFAGASIVGVLSIQAAYMKNAPPLIFSIPAVIPMVPGIFAYRTMLGIINLTGTIGADYNQILAETINNGTKASFIIMALAVGVGIPTLITRKESTTEVGFSLLARKNFFRKSQENDRI